MRSASSRAAVRFRHRQPSTSQYGNNAATIAALSATIIPSGIAAITITIAPNITISSSEIASGESNTRADLVVAISSANSPKHASPGNTNAMQVPVSRNADVQRSARLTRIRASAARALAFSSIEPVTTD
jgi:hypothetical protein